MDGLDKARQEETLIHAYSTLFSLQADRESQLSRWAFQESQVQRAWERVLAEMESAARAVASLEVDTGRDGEDVCWDISDRESLNSVCHLGCAGPTLPSPPMMRRSHMKNEMGRNLMPGLLEVEVDGSLFNAGGQLEDLVKAARNYGQLRYEEELARQIETLERYIERLQMDRATIAAEMQELSKSCGEDWMREAAEKREESREKEGGSGIMDLKDLKEDLSDQSPRKRIRRAVSYHSKLSVWDQNLFPPSQLTHPANAQVDLKARVATPFLPSRRSPLSPLLRIVPSVNWASLARRVQSCLAAILFLAAFLILVANLLF